MSAITLNNSIDSINFVIIYPIIKNGDLELLKTINFNLFTKKDIYLFINDHNINV